LCITARLRQALKAADVAAGEDIYPLIDVLGNDWEKGICPKMVSFTSRHVTNDIEF